MFIDTSSIVALVSERESHHSEAVRYFRLLRENGYRPFVSNYIVSEVHARILNTSKVRDQFQRIQSAIRVVEVLHNKHEYTVLFVDEPTEELARQSLPTYPDKQWSLTDVTSFLLMRKQGIKYFLSFDSDFNQASYCFEIVDVKHIFLIGMLQIGTVLLDTPFHNTSTC